MPQNFSTHTTGNDELDLELIQREIYGTNLAILAYVIFLNAAYKARELILEKQNGIQPTNTLELGELVAIASTIGLISEFTLSNAANDRLKELENIIQSGTGNPSLIADINIVNGYSFSNIGHCLRFIGTFQKINNQSQTPEPTP